MANCLKLEKTCSFGLSCVSFVTFYQFVCVLLSLMVLGMGCNDLFVLVSGMCPSFYFS